MNKPSNVADGWIRLRCMIETFYWLTLIDMHVLHMSIHCENYRNILTLFTVIQLYKRNKKKIHQLRTIPFM